MQCYCCEKDIVIARKVKLRRFVTYDPQRGGPESMPYQSYVEQMTYRWAFICNACYRRLDNSTGLGAIVSEVDHSEWIEIRMKLFNLAGSSRGDKATTVDEAKYLAFQRKEAEKLGM